ncbi:NAD(P)/FAD-dependent oxidoreductase [Embleya sp. NPDC008237]|uniref:NAD(P)/FAD-dependent oxidoreductase n=1 Tax=Embleya sp. NPDC008237 TaxID=3363978 RepID=UPI0036E36819
MTTSTRPERILIVGGGYVGLYTALRLQRKLKAGEATVTVVEPQSYMTYQPFLPEAAAGAISPRHVVVPLRSVLPKCRIVTGTVEHVNHAKKTATIELLNGETYDASYDLLVVAPGSVARTLPIPGLAEWGIGFKTVEEAIALRNHVLEQMDTASSTRDPSIRDHALTFVFVGGGYAGVEALAELEDMARYACRYYHNITPADMRWILVEASPRILPEVGEDMGRYTVAELRRRGIDVRLNTRLESARDRHVVLSDGTEVDASTLVWTAGVKPSPMLIATDLPLDDKGRLKARATLEVDGVPGVWTAGDCAAVPDLTKPGEEFTGPSAQHAVRQARVLADNIIATLRDRPQQQYRHKYAGSVASLGLHKGVAQVYGIKTKGLPAWFMHRTYHLSRVPTMNRKMRIMAEWTLSLMFRREIVSLGSIEHPRAEFEYATRGDRKPTG